jgi:hypothetical protein
MEIRGGGIESLKGVVCSGEVAHRAQWRIDLALLKLQGIFGLVQYVLDKGDN